MEVKLRFIFAKRDLVPMSKNVSFDFPTVYVSPECAGEIDKQMSFGRRVNLCVLPRYKLVVNDQLRVSAPDYNFRGRKQERLLFAILCFPLKTCCHIRLRTGALCPIG